MKRTDIERESLKCELTNSSHRMTDARMTAWRVRKSKDDEYDGPLPWVEIERLVIEVSLVPGYSSKDHLFDRTLVQAEHDLDSTLYDDLDIPWSNGRPDVTIVSTHRILRGEAETIPQWVMDAAYEIVEKHREKAEKKAAKQRKAMLASCRIIATEERPVGLAYMTYAGQAPEGWQVTNYPTEIWGGIAGNVYHTEAGIVPAGFHIVNDVRFGGVSIRDYCCPTNILFATREQAEMALKNARGE